MMASTHSHRITVDLKMVEMFISWGKQKHEVKGRRNYSIRIARIFVLQLICLGRLHKQVEV